MLALTFFFTDYKIYESNRIKEASYKVTTQKLTSIFENSQTQPAYEYAENIQDDRGITFGYIGFTSGTYDGTEFLIEYKRLNPKNKLIKYIPVFKAIDLIPHDKNFNDSCNITNPIVNGKKIEIDNSEGKATRGYDFIKDFASRINDPFFSIAQDNLVDKYYWNPSQKIAEENGIILPITKAQFYDACINHGLDGLENLIDQTNKAYNGKKENAVDEEKWLEIFLDKRRIMFNTYTAPDSSDDRITVYESLLKKGNVELTLPITVTCYGDTFTLE